MSKLGAVLGCATLFLAVSSGASCGDAPGDGSSGGGAPGGGGGQAHIGDPGPVTQCLAADELDAETSRPLGRRTAHGICVSVSFGSSVDRAEIREAYARCLATRAQLDAGPGTLEVRKDGASRVSSVTFAPDGGEGWGQTFDYDDGGRLTRWALDFADQSEDRAETFAYDTSGRITSWNRNFAGPSDDVTETFAYDPGGRLSSWKRDFATAQDVTETSTFLGGQVSTWKRDFAGGSEDVTETYTYDAMNQVKSWKRDYSGLSTDLTIDVTYSGSTVTASLKGAAASVVVRQCPP